MSTVTLTGDDYRYRFEAEPKQRFIELLRERFDACVTYKKRVLKWDTVIEQKTLELSRFLTGKTPSLNFTEPTSTLERQDNREVRETILALTQSEAEKIGIGKSELHYLRRKAGTGQSFRIYSKVSEKITSVTYRPLPPMPEIVYERQEP